MKSPRKQPPTREAMRGLLLLALPGTSTAILRLRDQILDFCQNIIAMTILLRGPIGAGKSTVARIIGELKRIAPLQEAEASRIVGDMRLGRGNLVDVRLMPWYVELALTGLIESLAESQLFGVVKGAFTGAVDRAGVFEMASTGRDAKDKFAGVELTGGVVFLDEVGDLTSSLQAKLLPVLSGGTYYRVGAEGNSKYELAFKGVTITASWRKLDGGRLRPDLLSRISAHVIDVPGIMDRMEDFPIIVEGIQKSALDHFKNEVNRICRVDPGTDRAYWASAQESLAPLPPEIVKRLAQVDWSRHGNLRGLTSAVESILIAGTSEEEVISRLPVVAEEPHVHQEAPSLFERLLLRKANGAGLAGHLRELEVGQRWSLRELLLSDDSARHAVAKTLGIDEDKLAYQVKQLPRQRRARKDAE